MKYEGERATCEEVLQTLTDQFPALPWDVKLLADRCPHCNIGAVWYEHHTKTSDGSTYITGSDCGCTWCDKTWYDGLSFFGAGEPVDVD